MENKNTNYISAVGRRKEAVARVRLLKGSGPLTVNGKPIEQYFFGLGKPAQTLYQKPFVVTNTLGQYSGSIKLLGGGISSQLDAVIHGISRALSKTDADLRKPLKRSGFLTRDPRVKERRKYGLAQKARAKKQSPKR